MGVTFENIIKYLDICNINVFIKLKHTRYFVIIFIRDVLLIHSLMCGKLQYYNDEEKVRDMIAYDKSAYVR